MATILVVDDERPIADLVEVYLANEGFDVLKAYDGRTALALVGERPVDAAVLDVMLPDVSGFELCRRIRETKFFPIVMLTARVADADKINGLALGADDYVTKPFNPLELVARIKSQLRRRLRYDQGEEACAQTAVEHDFMGLVINSASHKATLYDRRPHADRVRHPVVPVRPPRQGRLQRGAVRGGVGRDVPREQREHGDGAHRAPAFEDGRDGPQAAYHPNRLGSGVHH